VLRVHYSALPLLDHPLASLREMRAEDTLPMFHILSQPAVYEHTSWNITSVSDLQAYGAQERSPGSMTRFAIVRRNGGEFVGSAGFHSVSPANRTAEIAYDLAPEVWGHGIAHAACEVLTRWAFLHVGLVRVQGTTLVSNTRSQRVLEACGFEREGLLRRYRMVRGTPGDFWMYSRLS
jgi:[ribosomal protein S5]-alanine N-acetyltransferase